MFVEQLDKNELLDLKSLLPELDYSALSSEPLLPVQVQSTFKN